MTRVLLRVQCATSPMHRSPLAHAWNLSRFLNAIRMASAGFVPASSHFTNGKFVTAVSRPSCRKQQSWTAQRVRLPARCCVEVLDHEPAIREQPVELADCIDGVGCRPSFNRATSERSEEHTSELQSHSDLVCRLL